MEQIWISSKRSRRGTGLQSESFGRLDVLSVKECPSLLFFFCHEQSQPPIVYHDLMTDELSTSSGRFAWLGGANPMAAKTK
ncbi:hypothetical protein AMTR_s00142p00111350 [Amborella trichopoda]|uniref:Uncharacterized protein n=1 Tax=Amborella trichopoda TaxID=13333 RepID=W1PDP7_AMBTC|nr:hypothetical protein AMTR_s00142p00111350 [Amborella trichopoda]